MRKIIIIPILILLVLPFILAADVEVRYYVRNGAAINLTEKCYNNGTYCSSTAVCNVTIINPEQSVILSNANMTNNLDFHSYPSFSNTAINGLYEQAVTCCDLGFCSEETSFFKVNLNGQAETTSNAFFYIGIIFVLLILIIICITGFLKSETLWVKLSLFWLSWLIFIGLNYALWVGSTNYLYTISFIGIFFKWVFYIQTLITFPLFLTTVIWYFFMLYKASKLQRMIDEGVPEDEAYMQSTGKFKL